jgi:hypothetical protein
VNVAFCLLCTWWSVFRRAHLRVMSWTQRWFIWIASDCHKCAGRWNLSQHLHHRKFPFQLTRFHCSCCSIHPSTVAASDVDWQLSRFCHRNSLALWLVHSWWCSQCRLSSPRLVSF